MMQEFDLRRVKDGKVIHVAMIDRGLVNGHWLSEFVYTTDTGQAVFENRTQWWLAKASGDATRFRETEDQSALEGALGTAEGGIGEYEWPSTWPRRHQ